MTDDRGKTARSLFISDHLWEAFSSMAVEMGSDREALINQALYTFARLNGFLLAADLQKLVPRSALTDSGRDRARQYFEVTHYAGPAPVPLEAYVAEMNGLAGSRGYIDHDRLRQGEQLGRMRDQPLEPAQLVIEFRPGRRVAVR